MSFSLKNRIILFILMVISLILFGSLGYILIRIYVEHQPATLTDAVFFSVATISTLGFYPSNSMLTSEVGRWFHIVYLGFGLGIIFGGIQTIVGPWFEMKIKQAERGWKAPLPKDAHVIICGNNDMASYLIRKLKILGIPFVLVDRNPREDLPHIVGDCTEIKVLKEANIERASALITLLSERENTMVSLTARGINKEINIIAISETESGEEILRNSGASVVIPKNKVLGRMIQYWATGNYKYEIFASPRRLPVEEKVVKEDMIGKRIEDLRFRERYGTIIAIYRNGKIIDNPSASFYLRPGDIIIYVPRGGEAS